MRDGDCARYLGKGVLTAVDHVNGEIMDALVGEDAMDQRAIDAMLIDLDGTPNKTRLGANAILGVSLAVATCGGRLAGHAAVQLPGRRERPRAARPHDEHPQRRRARRQHRGLPGVHDHAGGRLDLRRGPALVLRDLPHAQEGPARGRAWAAALGDEGGFAPNLKTNEEPLEWIARACEKAGYSLGEQIMFAMDPASTEFYDAERKLYCLSGEGSELTADQMVDYYARLAEKFPHRLHRGRHGRGGLGRLEGPDRSASAAGCSWWATTCSSPTSRRLQQGIEQGRRQLHPGEGQPDRLAVRGHGRHRAGHSAPATPPW